MSSKTVALILSLATPCYSAGSFTAASSEYVEIIDAFNPTEYTMSCWIYPNSTANMVVITRTAGDPATSWSHWMGYGSNKLFTAYAYCGAVTPVNGTIVHEPGQWHHILATEKDGQPIKIYGNGVYEASSANCAALWTGGAEYHIGSATGDVDGRSWGSWDGKIGDCRLYNRVLSDQEILTLASSKSARINTQGLIGHWRMDEGPEGNLMSTANSIKDYSGLGKYGSPTNTPTYAGGITNYE